MRYLFVVSVLLLLVGCTGDAPEAEKREDVFPVTVATVRSADSSRILSLVGTVRFRNETPLGFTTAGKVARISYQEGDIVRRGALLAALDTTSVSADLTAARAEQVRAEAEYGRIKSLFDQGWVTRARLEQTEASAKAAAARVSAAGFASNTSRITAPSNGIILARNVEPGQVVAAGTAVLILGETDQGFTLKAPVIDSDLARLSVGMPATVSLSALGAETIDGQISEIDGRADPISGVFSVTISLPADPRLRSGQIGTAKIALPPTAQSAATVIPAGALFDVRGDEGLVYALAANDRVKAQQVRVGALQDQTVTIETGLTPGGLIIVRGHEKLVNGAKVKPVGRNGK